MAVMRDVTRQIRSIQKSKMRVAMNENGRQVQIVSPAVRADRPAVKLHAVDIRVHANRKQRREPERRVRDDRQDTANRSHHSASRSYKADSVPTRVMEPNTSVLQWF